jgi:DNA-binding winged helix-turn-helix (wHTH) protein/ATP/maltotriose-dependent transcriptional regulator MalT
MPSRFGRFELDERARALRLDGAERPLQPLVFDLLVYLVEQRERVVPKEELLSKLWDGATVTDGSLQRAISLLRGVLRDGGMEHAVQTFARRGYRFCESAEAFDSLPDESSLAAADWEALGNAALYAGTPQSAVAPFERAVASFEQAEQLGDAARVALLLTNVKLEARELAIAKGWHQRASSYLRGQPEGKQHGLAEWLASRLALFEGRFDECRARARAALEIADRAGDPDLHCLGLVYQGHILIAQSEVRSGLSLHDEAGAAALAGRVSPWVGGIVFCSVIWAYLHLGDHHRAGQWTDEFTRWCERHASYCYPALCRLHRGEILAMRGELASAEAEVRRAREQLATSGPFCEGDACRVLGEIQLARGDLNGAEAAFREAHRLGWNPQPGLSLLMAARGDTQAAMKQLDRALSQPTWTDGQRRGSMLAVLARVAAMSDELERSEAALKELAASPELSASHVSAAELNRARGELAWRQGDLARAEAWLRESVAHWLALSAPLYAAEVRLRLSALLVQMNDLAAAELELSSAEAAFERVGANPLLERCRSLRETLQLEARR